MDDRTIALSLAVVMSVLIGGVEVRSQSRAEVKDQFSLNFAIYLLLLSIGNIATTLLAEAATEGQSLPGALWFWHAFIGVFAFEALIQNLNLTLFDRGVLSISDWITKARDNAVAKAVENNATRGRDEAQAIAEKLRGLPEAELRTYAGQHLGADRTTELADKAVANGADLNLAIALALAHESSEEAKAIAKPL